MGSSFQGSKIAAKGSYRNLLKAVRKHIGEEEHKTHFSDFIKQQFRKDMNPQKLKLAHDYTFYLNSVHHQKVLYFLITISVSVILGLSLIIVFIIFPAF